MERSFIVSKEATYREDFDKYVKMVEQQKKFINTFFNEKKIKANEYRMGGNGSCGLPFAESDKNNISFGIVPTEEDLITHGKNLNKSNEYGLCYFKKSSKITKEFAKRCVDEKIIINLYKPRVSDYFKSLGGFRGCGYQQFEYNNNMYLKMESKYLSEDDTPVGFVEIKLSEYYLAEEEFEVNRIKE